MWCVFVYDLVKSVHRGKDTSLEDNSSKGPGLICLTVGKLQTPPQMKRKEWIWALITDDRVCCLSALWSQLINMRVGMKCDQNLNRPIPVQLKSPEMLKADSDREKEQKTRYSEKSQQGKRDIWLLTAGTQMCIFTEMQTRRHTHTLIYMHYSHTYTHKCSITHWKSTLISFKM